MSKVHKWKVEKTKVKVVFRLQFHATHIPQAGWDKLFLSFIPAETGKATAKTNKANVRNGNCKWSDPIYEATRLLQDIRTKKYDDKLYKLIVAMGSSRASILGEADVNLAKFVDALKPSTVALPLQGCDSGTILHVTVQILTTKTGFREFEQQSVKGPHVASSHGISEPVEIVGPSSDDKIVRTRLRETSYIELPSVEEATESIEDGVDGSSHTSDSLHAEKTEIPLFPLPHSLDKTGKNDLNPNRLSTQGSNDWTHGWASDFSDNNDLTFAYEENNRLRVRLEVAESAFLQLKSEAKSLQMITDELGAETQAMARQLALELDSGQSLVREVSSLKAECSNLKRDISELESAKSSCQVLDTGSASLLILVENKVHEIRDRACMGMCADTDFEVLLRAIGNLKQGLRTRDGSDWVINQEDPLTKKEKMCELLQKLEESKTENELLVKKMNQMERYYESYIHQLEESHKETVKELGTLRDDHSSHLYTISLLQSQIEKLHEEINGLMVRSVEDKKGLEIHNKELEKRAVASENALKRLEDGVKLRDAVLDLDSSRTKLDFSNEVIETLQRELQDVTEKHKATLEVEEIQRRENRELMEKLKLLEVELQQVTDERKSLVQNLKESSIMGEELKKIQMSLLKCEEDKATLQDELRVLLETKVALESSLMKAESEIQEVFGKFKLSQEIEVMREQENRKLLSELELKEVELQQVSCEIRDLMQRLQDTDGIGEELERTKRNLSSCQEVNRSLESDLKNLQEVKTNIENSLKKAESDLEASNTKLELSTKAVEKLEGELIEVRESCSISSEAEHVLVKTNAECLSKFESLEADLELLRGKNLDIMQKSETVKEELKRTKEVKNDLENEIEVLRETNVVLRTSLQKSESDLEASTINLEISSRTIEKLENEVEEVREKIKISSDANNELLVKLELLEGELQQVDGKSRDLTLKLESSDIVREELEKTKIKFISCEEEKRNLENELRIIQERKVEFETSYKRVEADLKDCTTKLDFSEEVIQNLRQEMQEVTQRFERENSELLSRLEFIEVELQQAMDECAHLTRKLHEATGVKEELERKKEILENVIINLNLNLGEADKCVHMEKGMWEELEITASDLAAKLEEKEKEMILFFEEKTKLRGRIVELEKANISMQHLIQRSEENQRDKETEFENRLLVVLEGLIASDAESSYMQCQMRELCSQLDASRNEIENVDYSQEDQILHLKEELEFLRFSKEEAEILNLVLRSKLEEQHAIICRLNESRIELGGMRENQRELTRRLSEQTLKTEEYKNLSIHLRDLKEKADNESSNQATEKRETESLRIVFIKEQYESKIQELKNQIGVSKKNAEEMLVKLQNALDDVETGKKNEIALAKRIEELSISLSEMEAEMQPLRTDRRELVSAYDNLKTELECTLLSFDCCKEEKLKLETCFHECNEERRKIKVELDLVKRLMENMASAENGNVHSGVSNGGSIEQILGGGNGVLDINERGLTGVNGCTSLLGSPLSLQGPENSTLDLHREKPENRATDETTKVELFEKHQKLKLGLSLFQKELEKLKKENLSSLLPLEDNEIAPSLHGLERALSQLDMANEYLGSLFPTFKELAGSGNSLERVLALELELAEALQEKKRTDTSSFLKQHNDDEAIFQSFRDINELIQDMLELKKRHATVECELKEMHGRYSQLSLQFAEVEGERQKLMMSLKNRSPRKSC
ncbi:N-terminal C2 in EEIG1 and EHBP1 [Carex littledalei]|uniref:N-terminal C2 in EEIG1 and EHBP1 n=1 Tax=Carex littledalei TaxID=544730 RepID=A0A833QHB9_9POAL|nr:N-terminal C2 in EEIG1 and EHBP1 [Carex littledalei]